MEEAMIKETLSKKRQYEAEFRFLSSLADEDNYSLLENMNRSAFCAVYSPLPSDTVDVCFTYNYEIGSERINSGEWKYDMSLPAHYTTRFGLYMISLDPKNSRSG